MIVAKGLNKEFESGDTVVHANRDIDLTIDEGELVVLAGPSGSGKSTLLNLIGGLDSPTSGELEVAGVDLVRLHERGLSDFRREHVGFVFQRSNLVSSLTVFENAVLQLRLQGAYDAEAERRVRSLLDEVGLAPKADSLPKQLSGGQQQRAAIVRAVASGTSVVIADEPTASLDAENAHAVIEILQRLNREHGTTIVVSSHDERVIAVGPRVVHLVDGAIESNERKGDD